MLKGMTVAEVQALLASAGYYKGAIDGDAGPKTWAAVAVTERDDPGRRAWSDARRLIAAAQDVLDAQGHEPGAIDGYAGANTREALTSWRSARAGTVAEVERAPLDPPQRIPTDAIADAASGPKITRHAVQLQWPVQADRERFYGPAGAPRCTAGVVPLPFPFVIAWAPDQTIRSFRCHERVAGAFTGIFDSAARHYGEAEFRRLRLDHYGGCYNYRRMRGGSALSDHAWGIAVDLDPDRNQLRWGADRAAFARPEYVPFLNIALAHGATPAGYDWGADWMHLAFSRLR